MRARYPDHEGFIDSGGVKIGYEVYGSGPRTVVVPPPDPIVHFGPGAGSAPSSAARATWSRSQAASPCPTARAGAALTGPAHARLAEEEVPREGVRVQRVPVVARDAAGRYRSWTARRVNVGRGEGRSGLAFDLAVPRRTAPPQP